MSKTLPYWLAATYLKNISPSVFLKVLEDFANIHALFEAQSEEFIVKGLNPKIVEMICQMDWSLIEKALRWAEDTGCHLIAYDNPFYPNYLREISDPPLVLYVKGNKNVLSLPQVAIVGARNATPQGVANATQFAKALAISGLGITSGLALGVDGAAHRGALSVKGVTIGVAGTGLEHIYPPTHSQLYETIVQNNGAIISEFAWDTKPFPGNFPRRNRIIAGLSLGVLVIEAAIKSGSLITARHALEQGREVFAIPGSIHNVLTRGCHQLIRQGAKLVETAQDILEELQIYNQKQPISMETDSALDHLPEDFRQLLEKIEYDITPIDMIILRSGLTVSAVSSILLALELRGYVQAVTGGYVRTIQDNVKLSMT